MDKFKTALPERLRAREAADYLRVSRSTLSKWRAIGYGPPFHLLGARLICYLKSEIDAWLRECNALPRSLAGRKA